LAQILTRKCSQKGLSTWELCLVLWFQTVIIVGEFDLVITLYVINTTVYDDHCEEVIIVILGYPRQCIVKHSGSFTKWIRLVFYLQYIPLHTINMTETHETNTASYITNIYCISVKTLHTPYTYIFYRCAPSLFTCYFLLGSITFLHIHPINTHIHLIPKQNDYAQK
jgi:hypothetical protein